MNLPNYITLARIFITPLFVAVLLTEGQNWELWGIGLFLVASLSDLVDGWVARRRRQVTTIGILLDPLADKLLISAAFISLVQLKLVPAWLVAIIIGREFAVTGLRNIATTEGLIIRASRLGKAKMVFEVAAVCLILFGARYRGPWETIGRISLWLVLVVAVGSMLHYFFGFWGKITKRRKRRIRRKRLFRKRRKIPREDAYGESTV